MTQEDLERKVRESAPLIERLDKCHEMIGKMCSEGRSPRMTIPVQWDDEDFFISTTVQDAIRVLKINDGCICGSTDDHHSVACYSGQNVPG